MPDLQKAQTFRIPTLDGWRGIAILMVIVTHLQAGLLGYAWGGHQWLNMGQHGVGIFFVLSGYLITARLLNEEKINLRRFYLRRFFRLMPCAWTYLLAVIVFAQLTRLPLVGIDLWSSLFFFRNYFPAIPHMYALTAHFWSLSLEEQFYLGWPLLLALTGRTWALRFAVAGTVASAVYRFCHWRACTETPMMNLHTEVRVDALLLGCTMAILLRHDKARAWIRQHGAELLWFCIPAFMWYVYSYHVLIPFTESIVIAAMLVCTSMNPSSVIGRALEWKYLKFLGTISYSLYVWQELFLVPHWGWSGIAFLPFAAIVSWRYIEQPCIRFERKIEKNHSFWDRPSQHLYSIREQ
jgi:peptidoglycan/LPS O-acetylase OafA/YrhL